MENVSSGNTEYLKGQSTPRVFARCMSCNPAVPAWRNVVLCRVMSSSRDKYLIANSVVEMRNEHLFGWQFPLFTVEFRVPYAEEEKKYHLLSISSCQTLHKIHFT